jgi:hypothetical protein
VARRAKASRAENFYKNCIKRPAKWRLVCGRLEKFDALDGQMTIIDEIKAQVDLVELVQQDPAVKLRRSGKNWTGFCPFHANSHTGALIVFPDTGTWHCFGSCNDGGTVIDWILKKNPGYDVKEAIKELAKRANIPTGDVDGPELKQRLAARAREDALQIASRLFVKWLMADPEALEYVHSRGWTDETITASRLGFSGRATAAQVKEMKGEFDMHGIKHDSPDAVMILGFHGDVSAWAKKYSLDPASFKEKGVHGLMDKPGLVYAHKVNGRIVYLSRRQLPGHDVIKNGETETPWRQFNPYSALAGEKIPFFNHMHLRERDRVVIVEGQGDAITLAQWGIPAMALCGSAWKNIEDEIKILQDKYETIYFATDADMPGEKILTGAGKEEGKFPLTTTFGPMLWIARWPKFKWLRPDGHEKVSKDANDLAQYHADNQIEPKLAEQNVKAVFEKADPIVLLAAQFAGRQQGADRQKNLAIVLPLIARMPVNTRNDLRLKLAKALFPEDLFPEYKGAPIRPYEKLIGNEIKAKDEDDKPVEIEEVMGGWYPINEDGSEGYLLEMCFDKRNGKAKFAYAHIWLRQENNSVTLTSTREIGTANFMDINGKRYVPMIDDNVRYGTVRLPTDLGSKKPVRHLLGEIRLFITRYFLLDQDIHIIQSSLYALFTWVYDCFPYLPYLRARGAPGSGKSELMLLVGKVCYRMMTTAGLTSIAGFKGMAHIYKGTLMIDEVDSLSVNSKEDRGELRALLNVRAMKEQARIVTMMDVLKADGTHTFRPTTTFVFGPTLLTMYGAFKDPATESRCLSFDLYKRDVRELLAHKPPIEPGVIPPEQEIEAQALTNDLLNFRLQHWMPRIEVDASVKLTDIRVSARMNQVMRPLKVLAHLQDDKDLMADLNMVAEINFEEEQNRAAASFEAMIARAIAAVDSDEEFAKYVQRGKLKKLGVVRYVLAKDLALISNQMMDAENFTEGNQKKKDGEGVTSKTVSEMSRNQFRLPVERAGSKGGGNAIVLDKVMIDALKFRFSIEVDMAEEKPKQMELES